MIHDESHPSSVQDQFHHLHVIQSDLPKESYRSSSRGYPSSSLERVIRQSFTRLVIYSTDHYFPYHRACKYRSSSGIHHHHISIVSHPSSPNIDHLKSSITFLHPSSSVIHHLQLSIIIKYRSSSGIRHHPSSIIFSHPSSTVIHHLQSSIIYSHPSSSHIDHLQASIIIKYQRDLFSGRMLGFSRKGILLMNMNVSHMG